MQLPPDIYLRLSAQDALLRRVTPDIRSVSVDIDDTTRTVYIRFIFEGEPPDAVLEAAEEAVAQIMGDFRAPWTLDDEYLTVPPPEPMSHLRWLVYHRYENEWIAFIE
jgi:hypothetical protein